MFGMTYNFSNSWHDNGSFTRIASTDSEKAKIFNSVFHKNTEIPMDFPIDVTFRQTVLESISSQCGRYVSSTDGTMTSDTNLGSLILDDCTFREVSLACAGTDDQSLTHTSYLHLIDPNIDLISCAEVFGVRRQLKKGIGSVVSNNDHIRKCARGQLDRLFQFMFNVFFMKSYWPILWRRATIFPLIKGGIRNSWDVNDYRGISICYTFGKFFERLIFLRLRTVCEHHISTDQAGG